MTETAVAVEAGAPRLWRRVPRAPVGEVVVGAEHAAALPPGAVLERLPSLQVKGKEEPIEAYVLQLL